MDQRSPSPWDPRRIAEQVGLPVTARGDAPRPEELRASDADRERVVDVLREAAADGRITAVEHEERIERVYRARTLGELVVVTADLLAPDEQPLQMDTRPVSVFFRSDERKGRFVVPPRYPVTAFFGNVTLDLREALLQTHHVSLNLSVICGKVTLIVPQGVRIEMSASVVVGGRNNKVPPPADPGAPTIEIDGFVLLGEVTAKSPKPPKARWFGRRRPA
ncbi:DUF1707 SHOCT-like domain-containing protein [Rhizohabitans arisaemae]|uniref:DUF1707 SHOCT-like domain-containing protein n=1 Tax=Rhizohabitans arisaemae TaxID=2720610 RepID=UPI0024B2377E|nr:DUF1707 domain-containing protein [Rhizohabitans arisaemae]